MQRRAFLRSAGTVAGVLGAGGFLAACAGDGAEPTAPGSPDPTEPAGLNIAHASIETLAGEAQRFAFGLFTVENVPVRDAEPVLHVRDLDGEVLSGPYPAAFHDEGGSPLGVYLAHIDVPEPGMYEVLVEAGGVHGTKVINVIAAEDSTVPVPGAAAIPAVTPTFDDDLGVSAVCTREPDCPMHELTIEQALEQGRPFAVMFATPAYCTSAICGPAVDTLDGVRAARDWGDVAFIHVEIFRDEGQTVTRAVQEWGLRSEPWFFTVDRDGTVVDRVDGPMMTHELSELVDRIA